MDGHSAHKMFEDRVQKKVPWLDFVKAFNDEVEKVFEAGTMAYSSFIQWYNKDHPYPLYLKGEYLYDLVTTNRRPRLYIIGLKEWHDSEDYKDEI